MYFVIRTDMILLKKDVMSTTSSSFAGGFPVARAWGTHLSPLFWNYRSVPDWPPLSLIADNWTLELFC